jgi:P27 family predicted phage terminase small subunit
MRTQPAPRHLSARAKTFWKTVMDGHVLEPFQLELLRRVCEQLDRADQARVVLKREGLTTIDRFNQPREHPAVAIERQAHFAIARLLRELNLDISAPDSRPPTLAYGG